MEKCYECEKGNLKKKKVKYKLYGIEIGKYPAEVCDKCGEIFDLDEIPEKCPKCGT